ncbi:hypothetical protein [Hymenobacter terricola]|uniref:hypothetical protein n=1 Tax=Hymenobacter terricola TaxID=2819236 RepID=UPI001B307C8E|nr:hypothetical protein [Hymenobacter terricola]
MTEGTETAGITGWDADAGLWHPVNRVVSTTRHDTTYAETIDAKGAIISLVRTFRTGPGKHIYRHDYLNFSPGGLDEPKYYYVRTERDQVVESGAVDFSQNLDAYIAQHPEAMRYVFGSKRGFYALTDYVARQSTGTYHPTTTATYNRQGQLLAEVSYNRRTTYQRDAHGRAQTSQDSYQEQPGNRTTYTYRPDGLLASETVTQHDGTPDENRYYRYTFY